MLSASPTLRTSSRLRLAARGGTRSCGSSVATARAWCITTIAAGTGGALSRASTTRTNCITQGGIYLLAISRYNRDAVDANGNLLWNDSPFRALRCADGPGAANPIAGWTGTTPAGGRYVISLQGAHFVDDDGTNGGDVNLDGCVDDADLLRCCSPSDGRAQACQKTSTAIRWWTTPTCCRCCSASAAAANPSLLPPLPTRWERRLWSAEAPPSALQNFSLHEAPSPTT
jgi:hypothetical protein